VTLKGYLEIFGKNYYPYFLFTPRELKIGKKPTRLTMPFLSTNLALFGVIFTLKPQIVTLAF
jgi:hypothetical protein